MSREPKERLWAPEERSGLAALPDWTWVLLLWLAAAVFFSDALFGGRSFWFRDTLTYYFPQASLTLAAWRAGEIPLWEPTVGLGYPFQSDPHSMVFYPLSALLFAMPFPRAYDLFVVVHVPLAGSFLYLLLRRWKLSRPASALGAATLMFSGYTVSVTCLTTLLRGLTWMPAALLAFDGFLSDGRRRCLIWTALALAAQGSCTDPQYVFFTLVMLALAPWLRPGRNRCPLIVAWRGLAIAGALAGAILAYQYLPLGQLFLQSDRTRGVHPEELGGFGVALGNLYNLVLPVPFSDMDSPFYLASFHGGMVPFYPDLYWGWPLLALSLASFGWLRRGHEEEPGNPPDSVGWGRTAAVAGAIVVVALLLSVKEFPFFRWMTTLIPPLRAFRYPGKYYLFAAAVLPIMVALGFEGVRLGMARCSGLLRNGLAGAAGLTVLVLAAVWAWGAELASAFLEGSLEVSGDKQMVFRNLTDHWAADLLFALGLVLLLRVAIFLADRGKLEAGLVIGLLGFLPVVDLFLMTRQSIPLVDDVFVKALPPTAPYVGTPEPLQPPPRFVSYGLPQIRIDDNVTPLKFMFVEVEKLAGLQGCSRGLNSMLGFVSVRLASETALAVLIHGADRQLRDRLVSRLSTGVLLRPKSDSLPTDVGATIASLGPVVVQKLQDVVPRAFIAGRARPAHADEPLPSRGGLLGMPAEVLYRRRADGSGPTGELVPRVVRDCRITSYERHRVELEFELEGEGLLVLTDTFYPNWRARVDGVERPIVEVGGIVRGVQVRQGERRLVMTYEAWPFRAGAVISLLSLIGAGCALLVMSCGSSRAGKGSA